MSKLVVFFYGGTVFIRPAGYMIRRPNFAGFGMIEMMITVVIAAILLALAIPSFSTMLLNNRQSNQANTFVNALNYARSTALTRRVNATVCPFGAINSVTCGATWNLGWIVTAPNTAGVVTLLQSYQIGPNDPTLSAVPFNGVTATNVVFDPRGLATTQANFAICDSRGSAAALALQVVLTGFVQLGAVQGQAVGGGAITCP